MTEASPHIVLVDDEEDLREPTAAWSPLFFHVPRALAPPVTLPVLGPGVEGGGGGTRVSDGLGGSMGPSGVTALALPHSSCALRGAGCLIRSVRRGPRGREPLPQLLGRG